MSFFQTLDYVLFRINILIISLKCNDHPWVNNYFIISDEQNEKEREQPDSQEDKAPGNDSKSAEESNQPDGAQDNTNILNGNLIQSELVYRLKLSHI